MKNKLVWLIVLLVVIYLILKFGIALVSAPLPQSIINLCMLIIGFSLVLYFTTDDNDLEGMKTLIIRIIREEKFRVPLIIGVIALSALAAWVNLPGKVEPPAFARTVHPSPPNDIMFKGKKISLNPFRKYEKTNPGEFREHVNNGRKVYYKNCVFCHGDNLDGKGIYAHGLNPVPANFQDSGVIPILTESFLFWRISKGGPGLPAGSGPWSSSMPAWEKFLAEEEIWDVILFMSDFTGHKPREEKKK